MQKVQNITFNFHFNSTIFFHYFHNKHSVSKYVKIYLFFLRVAFLRNCTMLKDASRFLHSTKYELNKKVNPIWLMKLKMLIINKLIFHFAWLIFHTFYDVLDLFLTFTQ